ncbi:MAG: molybdopterin molybdotransferase MoeA, partial [Thermoplasmata archaeon]|nr:molybdopterin molybdotransferase MoeA [Thermoplasmata archaeon]
MSDHKRYHGHRLFGELMPPDRALALALDAVRPIERVERVPLTEATDRVLAQEVSSPVDVPDFPKAMMDGFAVRSEDVADGRTELRVVGEAHPGEPYAGVVGPRETVKTATGAPVPEGSDLVIEIEEVTFDEARAEVPGGLVPGRNVQPVGQDIGKGDRLLAEGLLLQPGHIGAAAALGIAELPVYARPRVAVFATGREIKRAGPLAPGEIYDINSYTLSGLIRAHGGTVELFDPIRDTYENIRGAVARAADFDAVVLSGSTSVGERDYLRDAAAELGEVLFHGLAVSPGK